MSTKNCCSVPPALSPEEYAHELARFGMTRESESQPTYLELLVERDQERISFAEFDELIARYGYNHSGYGPKE